MIKGENSTTSTVTWTIQCDVDDCDASIAVHGPSTEPSTSAWATAYDDGWRNRLLDRPYGRTAQGDLCPYHADRYDRGLPL